MTYINLKNFYARVKEKLNYFTTPRDSSNDLCYSMEELTKARIAILQGKCIEDLPEEVSDTKQNTGLEAKV
jgi:hypothetical protein